MIDPSPAPTLARSLPPLSTLDTTAGSVLHLLPCLLRRFGPLDMVALYISIPLVTYLPLYIGALFTPMSLTIPSKENALPFFRDFDVGFMFVVTLPCLVILAVTDQQVLTNAITKVQVEGTLAMSEGNAMALAQRWSRRFRRLNLAAQALSLILGGFAFYLNFSQAMKIDVSAWYVVGTHVLPVGYIFFYCLFLFYFTASFYVCRGIFVAALLHDIIAHATLHMLPLHPDKAGGLLPLGRLGLRNQYALTVLGLNLVLAIIVLVFTNPLNDTNRIVAITSVIIGYVIFGPIVFLAPLMPFRNAMLKNKAQLVSAVALRMRRELDDLHPRLTGAITGADEQMIERWRKIGAIIDELPVWPFDADTMRRFIAAYLLPLVIPLISALGGGVLKWVDKYLHWQIF
jgi:hypothetical protein